MAADHPDFARATEQGRWTGELGDLFSVLAKEAMRARGGWAQRVLRGGAYVQMRIDADDRFRLQLRICRTKCPDTPEQHQAFEQEVQTFLRHLAPDLGRRWDEPILNPVPGRGISALVLALFCEEKSLGKVQCADCPAIIPANPAYVPNRCDPCARKAGAAEVAARSAERQA